MKSYKYKVKGISFLLFVFFGIMAFFGFYEQDLKGVATMIAMFLTYYAVNFLLIGIFVSVKKTNLIKGIIFTIISIAPVVYLFIVFGINEFLLVGFFPLLFTVVPVMVLIQSVVEIKSSIVEEYVGYSADNIYRFVILRKNGFYEAQFEKLVQETLYNGEEYSAYESIDLEEKIVHIFDDYKKAKEYSEEMLVKFNNK